MDLYHSLQKLTPIRGRKHKHHPSGSSELKQPFTEANPDKGTETKFLLEYKFSLITFTEANPDKGTETENLELFRQEINENVYRS